MTEILFFILIAAFSYFGVEFFRRWSLQRNLFDVPNQRSSHTVPTPRGGGLVIVAVCLIGYLIASVFIFDSFSWAYFVGAVLIAGISWLDDLYTISFIWRFVIHILAALIVIISIGFFRVIYFPVGVLIVENGAINLILTFLWIVWLTNAYNFMDGIDGIAGAQAVCTGLGWLIIGKYIGADATAFFGGIVACSAAAFLIHNWQPAKIFMGDVGSAFLGYTFAVLPLLAMREPTLSENHRFFLPMIAVALNWLFVFDTVYTFFRRLLNGEKVWQAHRSHIYQKLVINGLTHQKATIIYALISFLITTFLTVWSIKQGLWETILYIVIITQTLGLIIYLYLSTNRK